MVLKLPEKNLGIAETSCKHCSLRVCRQTLTFGILRNDGGQLVRYRMVLYGRLSQCLGRLVRSNIRAVQDAQQCPHHVPANAKKKLQLLQRLRGLTGAWIAPAGRRRYQR